MSSAMRLRCVLSYAHEVVVVHQSAHVPLVAAEVARRHISDDGAKFHDHVGGFFRCQCCADSLVPSIAPRTCALFPPHDLTAEFHIDVSAHVGVEVRPGSVDMAFPAILAIAVKKKKSMATMGTPFSLSFLLRRWCALRPLPVPHPGRHAQKGMCVNM